jgi:uncharacterized membrane-anchored protein
MSRKSKFNIDNVRNPLEVDVAKQLRAFKGLTVEYESEEIPYTVTRYAIYTPDFVVTTRDGRKIYIESKGYLRPEHIRTLKLVKAQHPDYDIRLLFGADNKMSKASKTRYSKWAEKNGFPWCIKEIPKEWFHETVS